VPSGVSARAPRFVSRLERFGRVASTQDIVRGWLADGTGEVCVAVADEQSAGRGRLDRSWRDRPGRALLVSAGFRPRALPMARAWRLPAVAAMAMLDEMTSRLGPDADRLALKWPNDIVAVHEGRVRKVAGVLAAGVAEERRLASAVVGIGVNVDWPGDEFPPDLADAMWSLREASGGRHVDRDGLLAGWLTRLGPAYDSLTRGRFDAPRWASAQVTTGAEVEVDGGGVCVRGTATGVDGVTGALLLRTAAGEAPRRVSLGEVVRCRVGRPAGES
jgi:BirA family biotin operon repressor/biotin-[acetyl-CoA-carboxylase] ligase